MQEELLFEIALNSEGRRQIPRLFARVKFIFIASMIWSALMLITSIGSLYVYLTNSNLLGSQMIRTRLLVGSFFTLLHVILLPLQSYYFFGFCRQMRESVDEENPAKFNSSFRLLITNTTLCVVSAVLSIAYALFNILQGFLFARLGF